METLTARGHGGDLRWARTLLVSMVLVAMSTAQAQTPATLLEACNAMQPASKRMECLRTANGVRQDAGTASKGASTPQAVFTAPRSTTPQRVASAAPRPGGSQTCYTGPRGGTYTITASGRKNYSGC